MHPHELGSLFGVGSFITQRDSWLAPNLVQRIQLLGAGWVREELTASVLHSGPNQPYQWRSFDRVVNRERTAGLQVLGLLDYSNTWRYRSHAAMPHGAMDRLSRDFARYVAAVVRHFRGRISHWEVWNEPNLSTFWRPQPDPGDYALLLSRAYRTIKGITPEARVVLGGTSGVDLRFLHAVATRTKDFDAIAVHPYRVVPEYQLLRQVAALRQFHRPLWFTEIGWAASNRCRLCTDEQTQAGDLVRFYTLAASAGVRHIFWYDLRDDLHVSSNPEGHFGLLHRDLAGKPAFAAFRFLSRALAGARFLSADALGQSGVYVLRFQSSRGTVAVLWNTARADRTVSVPWTAPTATLLSLEGDVVQSSRVSEGRAAISLSAMCGPVYLVSSEFTPVQSPGPLLRLIRHPAVSPHLRVVHRPHPVRRARGRPQWHRAPKAARAARAAPATRRAPRGGHVGLNRTTTPTQEWGAVVQSTSSPTSVPSPSSTADADYPTPTATMTNGPDATIVPATPTAVSSPTP